MSSTPLTGPVRVACDHNGLNTTGYALVVDGVSALTVPASARAADGSVTVHAPTLTPGAHRLEVVAFNADGHAAPMGIDVTVAAPAVLPDPVTNVRIVTSPTTPTHPPTGKAVLQPADLSYLGMFKMPTSANGGETRYGIGLAFRRVNGQKRLFSMSSGGTELYESDVPVEALAPTAQASVVKQYGRLADPAWQNGEVRGIHWDPIDQRIYQTMGPYYDPATPGRTLFSATLTEGTGINGSLQRSGPWGLQTQSYKAAMGGLTGIPQWFADAHLGGKRLGLGFGGAYSTMGQFGPGSAGPALTAVAPPTAVNAQFSKLPDTRLLAHDWNIVEYTRPERWRRSPDVNIKPASRPTSMWYDGGAWAAKDGVGYWTWVDLFEAAGCWIDTPTKHGMLYAPVLATGDTWYEASDQHYTGLKHTWVLYDPMAFVESAAGRIGVDQVRPAWQQDVQYPFNRYPLIPGPEASGTPYYQVPKGMTFDPVDSRLYILMMHPQYNPGMAVGYDDPVVYVYQVR